MKTETKPLRLSLDEPVSIIIRDVRFEIVVKPFMGTEFKLFASMWQMNGSKRHHLANVKYGQTIGELEEKMTSVINNS
jgi:hypothetical protein